MRDLRNLFQEHGLIESNSPTALAAPDIDPWSIRGCALDRKLAPRELAVALAHIAKHRGFKSNSKRDRGANAPKDSSAMLKAIAATHERMGTYRTIGEMFAKDPEFEKRKRNRDGEYTRSILRNDQLNEVKLIFDKQRRMGNAFASEDLEERYVGIAFHQRPLADSEDKVGTCTLEPSEKRAAKRSPSFELFRFYARLASLRIKGAGADRALTQDEITRAADGFGSQKGMTFKRLRKALDLEDGLIFDACPLDEEGKRDVVNRSSGNGCAQGTNAFISVLGDAGWKSRLRVDGLADQIAFTITFREDLACIRKGLEALPLEPLVLETLMKGVEDGAFGEFKGAGHLSAKACRKIIPHLAQGLVYSAACEQAGYNHALRPATDLDAINNPVARKSITECVKQVKAIIHAYGLPGAIHVELARDVGKSKEERDKIRLGIDKRNKQKDRLRTEFEAATGRAPTGGEDLMRFELWREQNGRCLYTDREIHPNMIVSSDRTVEVDHILPWSRSGDDSFINKTLCFASANQEKRGRTPYEWLGKDDARWDAFVRRVESIKWMKGRKKRNYCLKDASVLEEKFRSRNLNDTKYATRIVLELLAKHYTDDVRTVMRSGNDAEKAARAWYEGQEPPKARVRVQSRPGALTDRLRRGWGLQSLKKNEAGERVSDDRHHALDALIVAATTASQLQRMTREWQEHEKIGSRRDFSALPPPWESFLEETRKHFIEIFVSRAERRRARGEGHAATIRQVVEREDGKEVYERKAVDGLTLKDLDRVKDPDRNKAVIVSLREWIEAGKPKDALPKSPKGDVITKVRLLTNKKVDVLVREGAADRGEMTRVDVFRKKNKKGVWQFYLVPIYPHQVMDEETWTEPPAQAVQSGTDELEWPIMDSSYEFLWSVNQFSFLEIEKSDCTLIDGYYRTTDRATASITLSPHNNSQQLIRGLGVKTLKAFRKYQVDRLGRRFEVEKEVRTWHGKVCT